MSEIEEKEFRDMAVHIESIDNRCKSNTHQIEEIKQHVTSVEKKQEAIYEMNKNIAIMAQSLTSVKDDVGELKTGQEQLSVKVTALESQPAEDIKKRWDKVSEKILILILGGVIGGIIYQILPWFAV